MRNDGGPAFPTPIAIGPAGDVYTAASDNGAHEGLTLRDWFAGQALVGISALTADDGFFTSNEQKEAAGDAIAKVAYFLADAMLRQRAKGGAS